MKKLIPLVDHIFDTRLLMENIVGAYDTGRRSVFWEIDRLLSNGPDGENTKTVAWDEIEGTNA